MLSHEPSNDSATPLEAVKAIGKFELTLRDCGGGQRRLVRP